MVFKHIQRGLSAFLKLALDSVLPPLCPATSVPVDQAGMVDPEYWAQLKFIRAPFCPSCGVPMPYDAGGGALDILKCVECLTHPPAFDGARAALVYDEISKPLILRFKHADQMHIGPVFTPWLLQAGQEILAQSDLIVPVPLHRRRLWARRYNQSAILARSIGKAIGKSVCLDALVRTKATPPQEKLNRAARAKNVVNVFAVAPAHRVRVAQAKTIVLVDDVLTTGATVGACAKALKDAGAGAVYVLTIARVLKE